MGRAMLIIMAGVIVAVGYIGYGTAEQGKQIIGRNASYAEVVTAKNVAHTAIQMAFQKMDKDSTWAEHHGEGNPWTGEINGNSFSLYVEYIYKAPEYWASDTIRVTSESTYRYGEVTANVVSIYELNSLDYVPDFMSPLTIATDNFNFDMKGSAKIKGHEQSGTAGCEDKPGITTMSTAHADEVSSSATNNLTGDPPIETDTTLSYQPTDELIARLEDRETTTFLPEGKYGGEMGTSENPGIFFLENSTTLNASQIQEGFGIMVVRSGGTMALEDSTGASLDIAGNFTFNGLVIFEDAFYFDGSGTPTINGSVLVGNSEGYTGTDIDIGITGTLTLQYDCTAEDYAKKAASLAVKGNKYKRLATFE